jgi:hypothetical protein
MKNFVTRTTALKIQVNLDPAAEKPVVRTVTLSKLRDDLSADDASEMAGNIGAYALDYPVSKVYLSVTKDIVESAFL